MISTALCIILHGSSQIEHVIIQKPPYSKKNRALNGKIHVRIGIVCQMCHVLSLELVLARCGYDSASYRLAQNTLESNGNINFHSKSRFSCKRIKQVLKYSLATLLIKTNEFSKCVCLNHSYLLSF